MRNELNKHLGGLCDTRDQTHWTARALVDWFNLSGHYFTRQFDPVNSIWGAKKGKNDSNQVFMWICCLTGLKRRADGKNTIRAHIYSFSHLTFQEFFAARTLTENVNMMVRTNWLTSTRLNHAGAKCSTACADDCAAIFPQSKRSHQRHPLRRPYSGCKLAEAEENSG